MCDETHATDNTLPPPQAEMLPSSQPRRGFLRWLSAACLALWTLPASRARAKKIGLDLTKAAELQHAGGSKVIQYKDTEILLVRASNNSIHAINNTCTHKKCKVKFNEKSGDLFCKCHKSAFKLDGTVVAGPAPRPLTTYPANLRADKVIIEIPE